MMFKHGRKNEVLVVNNDTGSGKELNLLSISSFNAC